jgi:hypothetical protein
MDSSDSQSIPIRDAFDAAATGRASDEERDLWPDSGSEFAIDENQPGSQPIARLIFRQTKPSRGGKAGFSTKRFFRNKPTAAIKVSLEDGMPPSSGRNARSLPFSKIGAPVS